MNKMILKKTEIHLCPSDEKSTRLIPFTVPEGVSRLFIMYSYSPKILKDKAKSFELIKENLIRDAGDDWTQYKDYEEFLPLKNLVTLSLRSPDGFRGSAHRQADNQYHEIGENFVSPGFIKGKITAGQWNLCLDVHALVTDSCTCNIIIEGEVS